MQWLNSDNFSSLGMASLCSCMADFCIYVHLVSTATGLLFVGFIQHCTVKIVFREYSKVELAVIVANRIHPLIGFTLLIDNWFHGLAFQEEWKKNKSQRSLILCLPHTLLGSCLCHYPHFLLWSQQLHNGPKHQFVTRCPLHSLWYSYPASCHHTDTEGDISSNPRVGTVP